MDEYSMDEYRDINYGVSELIALFESPAKYVMKNIEDYLKEYTEHEKRTLLHCSGETFYTSVKMTPLQYAAFKNKPEILRYLVTKCKVDVNQIYDPFISEQSHPGIVHTALGYAVKEGHIKTVKVLTECLKADINLTPSFVPSPLNIAVYNGDLELVEYLLNHGVKIEESHPNGFTYNASLMTASQEFGETYEQFVKLFIQKGVDINLADDFGQTPLHIASRAGNISTVEIFLNHSAVFKEDSYGLTPLYTACVNQQYETMELLLNHLVSNHLLSGEEKDSFADVLQATIMTYSINRNCCSMKDLFKSKIPHVSEGTTVDQYIDTLCGTERNKDRNKNLVKSNNTDWSIDDAIKVYNRKFGESNPYTALLLSHIIREQQGHDDVLLRIQTELSLLQKLHEPNSLMFVWIELALILSQHPQICETTFFELLDTIAYCVHSFMTEHVWHEYCHDEWMNNFDSNYMEILTSDANVEKILLILYSLCKIVPTEDTEVWSKIKDILKVFATVTNRMLKQGICSKSPLHMLYSWRVSAELIRTEDIHKITCLLIKSGVSPDIKDIKGNTPLHILASFRGTRSQYLLMCGESLVKFGAHIDARNIDGLTPYETYESKGIYGDFSYKEEYKSLLTAKSPLSLKCICSTVLRGFNVQYRYTLPYQLKQYVGIH